VHVPPFLHSNSQVGDVVDVLGSVDAVVGTVDVAVVTGSADAVVGTVDVAVVTGSVDAVVGTVDVAVVAGSVDAVVVTVDVVVVTGTVVVTAIVVVFLVDFVDRSAHLFSLQMPLMQSRLALQIFLSAHFGHLAPPQSMSVSPLFFLLSLQVAPFSFDESSYESDGSSFEPDVSSFEYDASSFESDVSSYESGVSSCECNECSFEDNDFSCACDESPGTFGLSPPGRAIQCQKQITSNNSHT